MTKIPKKIIYAVLVSLFLATAVVIYVAKKDFSPPRVNKVVLSNGIKVFILEDHEFPTFQLKAYFKGGDVYDPPDLAGLGGMTSSVMRSGGTELRSPADVDKMLEDVAGNIELGQDYEYSAAYLWVLKENMDLGLSLLFEILKKPAFDEERIEVKKKKWKDDIRRQNEDPFEITDREFRKVVYGEGSPWARTPTAESIDRITRGELIAHHKRFYHPNNMWIAVSGDFDGDELVGKLGELTKDWEVKEINFPEVPPIEKTFKNSINFAEKDFTQSTIAAGHFGEKRDNPDKFALNVMNYVLGEGGILANRLTREIRSNEGLAYSVYSDYSYGKDYGLFEAEAQTEAKNTVKVVKRIGDVIRGMQETTDDLKADVEKARTAILRSLVFEYESRFSITNARARWDILGLPENYYKVYREGIERVTPEDVARVAKEYLMPDKMHIFVVGPETAGEELKTLGEVKRVELK